MISFFNPCTLKRTSGTRVLTHTYYCIKSLIEKNNENYLQVEAKKPREIQ